MGLFSKCIEGSGWSFDKQTGKLTISGDLGKALFPFKDFAKKVLSVEALPGARVKDGHSLFSGMENLREADLAELDVSECRNMKYMFFHCYSLSRIDLKKWKTSKVESLGSMFSGCRSLKEVDLSFWDVSGVRDFDTVFFFCYALETVDLTGWEISENADADSLFNSVPKTAHIFTDDVSVVRLLPEGVKPEPHGSAVTRFNTALAVDQAGDCEEAVRQYRLAAEQGSGAAAFNLALKYLRGKDVPEDNAEADRFFLRAAELDETDAMYYVANAFYRGDRSWEKDDKQALYWAQKVKEKGNLSEKLADQSKVDVLIRKIENNIAFDAAIAATHAGDYEEAAKQYRISAEKGSSTAAWNLSIFYNKGQGVPKSRTESFQWRRRAAEMGYVRAMYYLAEKYHEGKHFVEQDDEQALAWAEKAKKTGKLPPDKPVDDLILDIEKSLKEDPYNEGKHWLRNGDAAAAVSCFKTAAEQGNLSAAWMLGTLYTEGEYREKDDAEAFRWFTRAAELGHVRSMYTIAERYYTGTGGAQKDDGQALAWAKKAEESGELPADRHVDRLILRIETDAVLKKADEAGYGEEDVQSLVLLAEQGSGSAAAQLAKMYLNGQGVEQDRNLALHEFALASEMGDPDASSFLIGQDVDKLFHEATDAYERGDRTGALHVLHAAYRTNILRGYRGFSCAVLDFPYIRKVTEAFVDLFSEEGDRGTPWANYYLGKFYWETSHLHRHLDVPEDPLSAVPFYLKAMEAGCDQALVFMAYRTYYGDHPAVPRDRTETALLLSRASQSADSEVRLEAATRYMIGFPQKENGKTVYLDKEPDKALELMTALADEGHTGAMYRLSTMYAPDNTDFPNDPDKRLEYAKRAAGLGHLKAIQSLDSIEKAVAEDKHKALVAAWIRRGDQYYYGSGGVKRDIFSAIDLYERAGEFDAEAAFKLGEIFYYGRGISEDKQEAAKWFVQAAELGKVRAQLYAGEMYHFGDGIPLDNTEAAKWYAKAAENGNAKAQYRLGLMYALGEGVSQSLVRAESWFEKAAEQKDAYALLELGNIHFNKCVGKNEYSDYFKEHIALAKEYYKKAAALGNETAKGYLRNL